MDAYIGKTYKILNINYEEGVAVYLLSEDDNYDFWWFPWFVLEHVEKDPEVLIESQQQKFIILGYVDGKDEIYALGKGQIFVTFKNMEVLEHGEKYNLERYDTMKIAEEYLRKTNQMTKILADVGVSTIPKYAMENRTTYVSR